MISPTPVTAADLRAVPLFAEFPEEGLGRLAGLATPVGLAAGEYVVRQGDANGVFFVQLDGQTEWTKDVDGQAVYALTFGGGTFYGHEPILLDIPVPVSGRALTAVRLLAWERDAFWEMIALRPGILHTLLTTIAQRVQTVEVVSQQQEKLIGLGKLSAGLAHELNNPAAAARRAGDQLCRSVNDAAELGLELARHNLSPEQTAALAALRREVTAADRRPPALDPLARSDREDELAVWLDERGLDEAWDLAPTLVGAGLDAERLAAAVAPLPPAAVGPGLAWLAAHLATTGLVGEVEQATTRISELVRAIKTYTHLDRAPEGDVDVRDGLASTLTMLGHKLRAKAIAVNREDEPGLPRIAAFPGELNQVWTNLLDNAIDAVGAEGRITVRTAREGDRVLVEIADDGPGIAPEVLPKIWDPFFTTKGVGEGTGLGLDVSRRIVVNRHGGDIRAESAPGATRFQVRLPIGGAAGGREPAAGNGGDGGAHG